MALFRIEARDGEARAWILSLRWRRIETPLFMPVATKGTVKGLHHEEVESLGCDLILCNAYHLYLSPWVEVLESLWWIHAFMQRKWGIITDSWGFQVFSLQRGKPYKSWEKLVKVTDAGVWFRSYKDGSKHFFSPKSVIDMQIRMGSDIVMAFDECCDASASYEYVVSSLGRTCRWEEEGYTYFLEHKKEGQYFFPIVQGGMYGDLRRKSVDFVERLWTEGIAFWWFSVWESKSTMYHLLEEIIPYTSSNKVRYLMGIGTLGDILECIYRGIDIFDCVLPTRFGRHKVAFSYDGYIKISQSRYLKSDAPLETRCMCKVCREYSRGYLCHLARENEMLASSLISYHNIHMLMHFVREARKHILHRSFDSFYKHYKELFCHFEKI